MQYNDRMAMSEWKLRRPRLPAFLMIHLPWSPNLPLLATLNSSATVMKPNPKPRLHTAKDKLSQATPRA